MKAPTILDATSANARRLIALEHDGQRHLALPLVDDFAVTPMNAYALAVYNPDRNDPVVATRDASGVLQLTQGTYQLAGWMLHLPWAKNPVSLNRSGKTGGWRADAAASRTVRDLGYTLALHRIPALPRIRVQLEWHVTDRRTRDEDNLVKAQKHLVDGLRLAGVVHDDDRRYVLRDMPTIVYRPKADHGYAHMRLYVWPATPTNV